jgi:hypothetical protein
VPFKMNSWRTSSNFFIASNRFGSSTCEYRGTVCVDECPNIWAIVRGDTPAAVILDANVWRRLESGKNGIPAFLSATFHALRSPFKGWRRIEKEGKTNSENSGPTRLRHFMSSHLQNFDKGTLRTPARLLLLSTRRESPSKSTSVHFNASISPFRMPVSAPSATSVRIFGGAVAISFSCSSHVRMWGFRRSLASFTKNFVRSNGLRPMNLSRSAGTPINFRRNHGSSSVKSTDNRPRNAQARRLKIYGGDTVRFN